LGCSGTILKEISLGKKVGIIDLTRELGTRDQLKLEIRKCCRKILGFLLENLEMRDGFVNDDENTNLKL
jgi:hypothetical protein